ncbi:hypothetical protein ES705_13527 [subsurface metagenome]
MDVTFTTGGLSALGCLGCGYNLSCEGLAWNCSCQIILKSLVYNHMEKTALTPGEMAKARKKLYNFTFFSVISFTLLSGNIITLFSLRMGAGNFLIGLLSSFMYISYLFILIGRSLVKKYGLVKLMGRFWLLRYMSMIPILFAPIFTLYNFWLAAYVLIVISVLGFNVARGIATTSYNPIIGEITIDKERGAFLARLQVINHTVNLPVVITMAIILGRDAPLYRYTIFILVGIICGFYATYIFFKIPEPGMVRESLSKNLWKDFFDAVKRDPFRKFIKIHFLASFATYMITPFLLVNAMHITASVFINDDEYGLHQDYEEWLEQLAPHEPIGLYRHNRTGEDNADAHLKRQIMGREVVVAVTEGSLDFGPWEQIFYGEFDGGRRKRVLVKIIGE